MGEIDYEVYTALTKPGVGYVVVLLQSDFSYDRNRDILSFTFLIRYPDKLVLFDATKLIAHNIRPDVISSEQLERESLAMANGVVMNHLEKDRNKLGILHKPYFLLFGSFFGKSLDNQVFNHVSRRIEDFNIAPTRNRTFQISHNQASDNTSLIDNLVLFC